MGKITDILLKELSNVYCHNCSGNNNELQCEECYRKNMNWGLSETTANRLENEILLSLKE